MYAVIKTGGKQYRVAAGQKLKIEQIPADIGAEITTDQVLAAGSGDQRSVGAASADGATVWAPLVAQCGPEKSRTCRQRRRRHYSKTQGHRQPYTDVFLAKLAAARGTVEAGGAAPEPAATPAGSRDL